MIREIEDEDDETALPSNPFEPRAKAKPDLPVAAAGAPGLYRKDQERVPPSPLTKEKMPPVGNQLKPPPSRVATPVIKPQYRGNFFGQTQVTNGRVEYKPVSWKDKFTDDFRYGNVPSQQKVSVTWDGNDWISSQEFDSKYGKHRRK